MSETNQNKEKKKLNKRFIIILGLLVLIGGSIGIYKYSYSLNHEWTDNAQIEATITPIIPRVSGYVEKVFVKDDQFVKKGDTLLIIDRTEYKLRLAQAQADLAIAESGAIVSAGTVDLTKTQVLTADASVSSAKTNIEAAEIRVWRANQDYERYLNLVKDKVVTQQQFEQVKAEKESAEKQLEFIKEQERIASTQKSSSQTQTKVSEGQHKVAEARIAQAKTAVEVAELNLSYCVITAPCDGQVSKIELVEGELLQAGRPVFNLVLNDDLWVIANFKETQISDLKEGQICEMSIDAFDDIQLKGKIESIAPGTGSTFTLLPPDNATGNFVKVVQRVPVRVKLDELDKKIVERLRPGLSVEVTVTTK